MGNKQVTVIARVRAKQGMEETVKNTLVGLLEPSRADEGCINYDLHQDQENPALFMFHENWTSEEALNKHLATPHLQAFIKKADELLAEPLDVTLWKAIT